MTLEGARLLELHSSVSVGSGMSHMCIKNSLLKIYIYTVNSKIYTSKFLGYAEMTEQLLCDLLSDV